VHRVAYRGACANEVAMGASVGGDEQHGAQRAEDGPPERGNSHDERIARGMAATSPRHRLAV
jgi:hypothetical protein